MCLLVWRAKQKKGHMTTEMLYIERKVGYLHCAMYLAQCSFDHLCLSSILHFNCPKAGTTTSALSTPYTTRPTMGVTYSVYNVYIFQTDSRLHIVIV